MASGSRSYAGRSADQRAAERRARLVEATVALLATQGAAATTMTAICSTAGLTERYFYESFGSRGDALAAALDHACARIAEVAEAAFTEPAADTPERVRAAVTDVVRLGVSDPAAMRVAVIESSADERLREVRRAQVLTLADLVQRHAGSLFGDRPVDRGQAHLHAVAFVGAMAQLVEAWLTGAVDTSADEVAAVATALFLGPGHRR